MSLSLEAGSTQREISKPTIYKWKAKYGNTDTMTLWNLAQFEADNCRRKLMCSHLDFSNSYRRLLPNEQQGSIFCRSNVAEIVPREALEITQWSLVLLGSTIEDTRQLPPSWLLNCARWPATNPTGVSERWHTVWHKKWAQVMMGAFTRSAGIYTLVFRTNHTISDPPARNIHYHIYSKPKQQSSRIILVIDCCIT